MQNSVSGSFDGKTMTLTGVGPTIFFSDRPYRVAGQVQTAHFIGHWDSGSDNFEEDPPNATLSVFGKDGIDSVVVELTGPNLKGHTLSYKVRVFRVDCPHRLGSPLCLSTSLGAGRCSLLELPWVGRLTPSTLPSCCRRGSAPVYTAPVALPEPAPPAVNVTVTPPASGVSGSQAAAIARLKELKSLLSQGLITQAQYQEESQKLLNEIVQ